MQKLFFAFPLFVLALAVQVLAPASAQRAMSRTALDRQAAGVHCSAAGHTRGDAGAALENACCVLCGFATHGAAAPPVVEIRRAVWRVVARVFRERPAAITRVGLPDPARGPPRAV